MGLETCIDQQDLKAFALGHLDEDRSEVIAAHLSACTRCEETMAGFDDTDDSMLAAVREAAGDAVELAAATPAEAVLEHIANPWSGTGETEKSASTGEWIRDYELLEPLGHGGMGTVYKAVHARLQRPVAIKLLPSRRLRDPDAVARFEREMKAIGRLDHPAIVRATDAGDADGTHFLVMDYVDGIDLSQLIKLTGPMDVASACEVIRQAAIGLQYAHAQGLIHRDVKPSNLMMEVSPKHGQGSLTREQTAIVKLLDLGLALFGAASEAVDELTTVGQLMGTLDYMAPEQADDSHDVDARADVYSLGATMFKLLTGTAPYETSERRTPLQKMKALATVDAPSVRTRQPALPDDLATIVDRMLLRDPTLRFQSAAEVAQAVAPFCAGHRLAELTQQAMQSRHHSLSDEPLSGPVESRKPARPGVLAEAGLPNEPPASSDVVPMVPLKTKSTWPSPRLITRSVMATLGILFVIAAGVLIRIKTDTGTLIIECASSDVPVEIRQGKDTVKELTLSTGKNKVTLRSGSYEIVLPAEYDSLTLDVGKFELSRGGEWIARISENTDSAPIASVGDDSAPSVNGDELLPPQSVSFTGPSVMSDVTQIISNPIRQVEFQRLRDRYAELLRKSDALQDSLNKEAVRLGDDHPRVRMFRNSIEVAKMQSDEVRDEMQKLLQIEKKIEEETALSATKRAAEAFDPPRTDTAQPLYAGKTFDQWLQVIQTERSPAELTNAVDALSILGAGSRDAEAAKQIFEVIARHSGVSGFFGENRTMGAAAVRAIRRLRPEPILPVIRTEFDTGNEAVQFFVTDRLLSTNTTENVGTQELFPIGDGTGLLSALAGDPAFVGLLVRDFQRNSQANDGNDDPMFSVIARHIGSNKPNLEIETLLRKLVLDALALPETFHVQNTPVKAALILARHWPDESLARLFVKAIRDASVSTPAPTELDAWRGLTILGKHAESALPFMYEILNQAETVGWAVLSQSSRLPGKVDAKPFVVKVFDANQDGIEPRIEINPQLLAIEVIGATGTRDEAAIEALKRTLKYLVGQEPADGPVEFCSGRDYFLLQEKPQSYTLKRTVEAGLQSPFSIEITNSCLLAWKALTGSNPRFASSSLGELTTTEWPAGVTVENMPKFVSHSSDDK